MFNAFDILKKLPDGGIVWIEGAEDLETARERIKLFATYKPGEYVIFRQETQSVIEMPWVSFVREELATSTSPKTAAKKTNAKLRKKFAAKPKTSQVIAEIVADISRTVRHK